MEPVEDEAGQLLGVLTDPDQLVRAVASGRQRGADLDVRRLELRWVSIKAGLRLQVVSLGKHQANTSNLTPQEAPAQVEELLAMPFASWHVETPTETIQVRVTKKGRKLVSRSGRVATEPHPADRDHDRTKARFLSPDEEFLEVLGITTDGGRVRAARRDKYMQVEAFVRALDPVVPPARDAARTAGRPMHVVDLGCGNAYLTMAAYDWLSRRHGLEIDVTGVDTKAQAREHNADVAARLGWSEHMVFVAEGIGAVELGDAAGPGPRPACVRHRHRRRPCASGALGRAGHPRGAVLPPRSSAPAQGRRHGPRAVRPARPARHHPRTVRGRAHRRAASRHLAAAGVPRGGDRVRRVSAHAPQHAVASRPHPSPRRPPGRRCRSTEGLVGDWQVTPRSPPPSAPSSPRCTPEEYPCALSEHRRVARGNRLRTD
ncbi:MAG: methyltransferase [Nocardioidaceae bacterium]